MNAFSRQPLQEQLTQREREILRLMADGATNQEIANRLFITPGTVKWYGKQIYSKLQVNSRTQAIAQARLIGLLDGASAQASPLTPSHTLPVQLTPFIGRANELAYVGERLTDPGCRLLTLVGPGGVGKTRLALEAAERIFVPNGVYFVALAPLSDPGLMPLTIAEVVRFAFMPGDPPKTQLLNYLHDKRMLLVLDNFEHLLAGVDLVLELLQHAPGIKILVTSRERLQVQSETVFRLDGFPYDTWTTPEDAVRSDAAGLFLQSAQRVQPTFELNRPALVDLSAICRLVDGMPLGLLLAASWVDVLSLTEIAEEIARSFAFLEGELRDLPERQRSLRAVFVHSWGLLSEAERAAMRCVSVFRGGFTREAAREVGDISLKTLTSLVNKSLLTRNPDGRFEVHELLRQYSETELDQLPTEREQIQLQHAMFYAEFIDEQWKPLRSAAAKATGDLIELDIDNVRSAWTFGVRQVQLPLIATMTRAFWCYLEMRSRHADGIDLFELAVSRLRLLPGSEARDKTLADLLQFLAAFYGFYGQPEQGKSRAEESLSLLQHVDAVEISARAENNLAFCALLYGEFGEVTQHAQRAIALARQLSDPWYSACSIFMLGYGPLHLEEYEDAYQVGLEAIQYAEKSEDPWIVGVCCVELLGRAATRLGYLEEAKRYFLRGIACFESSDRPWFIANTYRYLTEVYALLRQVDAAKDASRLCLNFYKRSGATFMLVGSFHWICTIFDVQGNYTIAVELLALELNHSETIGSDLQQAKAVLDRMRPKLSNEAFAAAYERGKILDIDVIMSDLLAN